MSATQSGTKKSLSWADITLAILAGITPPWALAPIVYAWYFEAIGWPAFSITHPGPLNGAPLGDQLCWGNVAMLVALPTVSLLVAARTRRRKLVYLAVALTIIQVLFGLLNFVPLLALLGT
jgi:hypothetical protein